MGPRTKLIINTVISVSNSGRRWSCNWLINIKILTTTAGIGLAPQADCCHLASFEIIFLICK